MVILAAKAMRMEMMSSRKRDELSLRGTANAESVSILRSCHIGLSLGVRNRVA